MANQISYKDNYLYRALTEDFWSNNIFNSLSTTQRILINMVYSVLGIHPKNEFINSILKKLRYPYYTENLTEKEKLFIQIFNNISNSQDPFQNVNISTIIKDMMSIGMGEASWKWSYKWLSVPGTMLAELIASGLRESCLSLNIYIRGEKEFIKYKNFLSKNLPNRRISRLAQMLNVSVNNTKIAILSITHWCTLILQLAMNITAFFIHLFNREAFMEIKYLAHEIQDKLNDRGSEITEYFDEDILNSALLQRKNEIDKTINSSQLSTMKHDEFMKILNDDSLDKHIIQELIIRRIQDKEVCNQLANILKSSTIRFNHRFVFDLIVSLKIDLSMTPSIFISAYPTDEENRFKMVSIIFDQYTSAARYSKDSTQILLEASTTLKEFLKDFKDLSYVKKIYKLNNDPGYSMRYKFPYHDPTYANKLLTPDEWLTLLKKIKQSEYSSIKGLLSTPLNQALTLEGSLYFNSTFVNQEIESFNLYEFILYLDLNDNLRSLNGYIKPQTLSRIITQKARTSPYVSNEEYTHFFDATSSHTFPSMELLCDFLSIKTIDFQMTTIDESIEKIKSMNYNDNLSKILIRFIAEHKTHQKMLHDFREQSNLIFCLNNQRAPKVAQFLKTYLDLPHDINSSQHEKLFDFFNYHLKALLYLLSMPDGRNTLIAMLSSLNDGCVANIGTQMQLATYQSLLRRDIASNILYTCFLEKIVGKMLYAKGSDGLDRLGGQASGTNPVQSPSIRKTFISPTGLVAAIASQFYCDGKAITNPWDSTIKKLYTYPLLRKKYGITTAFLVELKKKHKSVYIDLKNKLTEEADELNLYFIDEVLNTLDSKFNKKSANLVAYLVLRQTIPDILTHPSLKDFNKTYSGYAEQMKSHSLKAKMGSSIHEIVKTYDTSNTLYGHAISLVTSLWSQKTTPLRTEQPQPSTQNEYSRISSVFEQVLW